MLVFGENNYSAFAGTHERTHARAPTAPAKATQPFFWIKNRDLNYYSTSVESLEQQCMNGHGMASKVSRKSSSEQLFRTTFSSKTHLF